MSVPTQPPQRLPAHRLAYSVTSAAAALDVSRATVHALIRSGALPAIRLSEMGDLRIPATALERLISRRYHEARRAAERQGVAS